MPEMLRLEKYADVVLIEHLVPQFRPNLGKMHRLRNLPPNP